MSEDHALPYRGDSEWERMFSDAPVRARRRRWPWVLLVVAVVLALLAVAAELAARSILPGVVRSVVIDQLELPADQQLDVSAGGILIPQLLAGSLDELRLSTDAVTVQGLTGAADITARDVPLRGGDLTAASGTVRLGADQFIGLLADSELPVEAVTLAGDDATLSGSVSVFGFPIPVDLTVTPSADAGELLLTPVSIAVGGAILEAEQVEARLGSVGERLTRTQPLCVADQLPAGVALSGLAVEDDVVVADFDVDSAILTDEALQANGTCPGR